MSFPYAPLHFEAQQAKQRLAQVLHARPVVHIDSLSPALTKGVPVYGRAERRCQATETLAKA
jgi:hypothetical protein